MMKQENKLAIREAVAEAAEFLKDRIKPTAEIPNRNAYAHIWKAIKTEFGHSYKECSDEDLVRILEIISETRAQTDGELNP
jgi:hypothetical protein